MRLTTAFSVIATATSVSAQFLNQTGPFKLQLVSQDDSLNGKFLAACHEGAAIESLCPLNGTIDTAVPFYYNYSDTSSFVSTSGYLTFLLPGPDVFEPMSLSYNPASNVAVPLFSPAAFGTPIAFDDSDLMYIPSNQDDTEDPINIMGSKNYYRWYVCTTYEGYVLPTLAWALGDGKPQNPTCCEVSVKRITA
jgi:hypothetical protein